MNVGYLFLFISFATLLSFTKEVPIEGSTLPPEPDIVVEHHHGSHVIVSDEKSENEKYGLSDDKERDFQNVDRSNHSRMLTLSTTLGYDDWWFLTTRRPNLSLKDFPGRPGVATWKEISPGSSVENRKSRKITGPTAASVSSGSWSFTSKYHYAEIIWKLFWMIFLLFCLCWT